MQLDHLLSRVPPVSHTTGRVRNAITMLFMTTLLDLEAALESRRSGVVAVERPDLALLDLRGADVLRYLHTVSSQHTAELRLGEATSALLLSPKGKIEFAFRVAVTGDGALLDTQAGAAEALAERLARFVFRYDVSVRALGTGGLTLLGPGAGAALEAAGLPPAPPGPERAMVADGLVVHRTAAGADLLGDGAGDALAALERAGVPRAPREVWELARIELGLPRWGDELTDDVLAEEAGLIGSHVHLEKGCYPGQETVARVHNLGQVQRRLAGLRFEGEEPPAPRSDLRTEDGRRAGQVRGVARHPELGPIGLAFVRQVAPAGTRVLTGDSAAVVVELPFQPERPKI
jgi:tRNA-modifying protein YgfZ